MIRGAVDRGGDENGNDGGSPQRPCRTGGGVPRSGDLGAVVVRDMALSLGSAAPDAPLTTPTNATARIDTRPRESFGPGLSKPPGPFVADAGTRQRTGAETN